MPRNGARPDALVIAMCEVRLGDAERAPFPQFLTGQAEQDAG